MVGTPDGIEVARITELAGDLRVTLSKLYRRLREQAHAGDFTSAQKSVVLRLERDGPATVAMLAKAESVRHQSLRITIAGLEERGVVTGEPDPADGRQTIFRLTPATRETIRTARAAREDWLFMAIQSQLSPSERVDLAAAMSLMARLAEFSS